MIFSLLGIHDDEIVWLAKDEDFDDGHYFYLIIIDYYYYLNNIDEIGNKLITDELANAIVFNTIEERDEYIKSRGWG